MTTNITPRMDWPVEEMPPELQAMNEKARAIYFNLLLCSSEQRALKMCMLLSGMDTETFWQVFNECWNMCDNTWAVKSWLLDYLRYHSHIAPAREFMIREGDRELISCLPARIQIYRGCRVHCIRGLSWTLRREVAEGFACGHRSIPVENAVIASATIPKNAVFTITSDREESELVIDPRRLAKLTYLPSKNQCSTATCPTGKLLSS